MDWTVCGEREWSIGENGFKREAGRGKDAHTCNYDATSMCRELDVIQESLSHFRPLSHSAKVNGGDDIRKCERDKLGNGIALFLALRH